MEEGGGEPREKVQELQLDERRATFAHHPALPGGGQHSAKEAELPGSCRRPPRPSSANAPTVSVSEIPLLVMRSDQS